MGSIMCLGVSVSNSVMLVTFINNHWQEGSNSVDAAINGASDRLRPILMTACAMTIGMVPMALALEKGSEMQAPLGRAVIGGLVMSTFATLLMVPPIFALLIGKAAARTPSVYPGDVDSPHYDPEILGGPPGAVAVHPLANGNSNVHDDGHAPNAAAESPPFPGAH